MTAKLQYGNWGITVYSASQVFAQYAYPVGTRGPVNSAATERKAIAHCKRLGGEIKGPFFYNE